MTMRDNTERPVTTTFGTNKLMGSDFTELPNKIIKFNYDNVKIEIKDATTNQYYNC